MAFLNKKENMAFEQVIKKIKEDDNGKYDFKANLKDIEFDDGTGNFILPVNGEEREFDLTANAHNQIMRTLGIPSDYARKVPPSLLKPHIDHWKNLADPKDFFVRAKQVGDKNLVRAFLSPRYNNTLDNRDVVEAFIANINPNDYSVIDYRITDDMFNARVVVDSLHYNNVTGPDGKPNKFFAGLHIVNGETGNYSVKIDLVIWEQWCSNGAIRTFGGESLLSRKHIGNDVNLADKFNEALNMFKENAEETMELFVDAKQHEVKQPLITLNKLMNRYRDLFPKAFRQSVIDAYENRPEPTRYGIISALTQSAQELSYDKRLGVEKLAGDIMTKAVAL